MIKILDKYRPIDKQTKLDALIAEIKNNKDLMIIDNYKLISKAIKKKNLFPILLSYKSLFHEAKKNEITQIVEDDSQFPYDSEPQDAKVVEKPVKEPILPQITKDERYVFATYFEMGFHNFFITMNHVYGKVTGKDAIKDAIELAKSKSKNWDGDFANENRVWNPILDSLKARKVEEREYIVGLLEKHFRFLRPFYDVTKDKNGGQSQYDVYVSVIKGLSSIIRVLRNIYSHSKIILFPEQKEAFNDNEELALKLINICFDASKNKVKERFDVSKESLECVKRYDYVEDNNKLDEKGHPRYIPVMRDACKYQLYSINTLGERHLSKFGLVFLASLFLEKKYSKIMTDKLHCVSKSHEPIVCEMMGIYNLRVHIQKLSCTTYKDAIALDILNELQKCPKELFELLDKDTQDSFRVKATVDDNTPETDVLMVRHEDRFAYLLMKYIDETEVFKNLRFMVSLGRYFHTFYDKKCIDAENRVRSLGKDITGYGRITEVENARKNVVYKDMIRDYGSSHTNTKDEKPYITDQKAHYVFDGQKKGKRIGIFLTDEGNSMHLPKLNGQDTHNKVPTCWMSIYELPALAFLLHLTNYSGTAEYVIKQSIKNYKSLFIDVKEGRLMPQTSTEKLEQILSLRYGGIKLNSIPKNMKDYLLGVNIDINSNYETWATNQIKRMIDDTIKMQKRHKQKLVKIESQKRKDYGTKRYVDIKPGILASFLAKDMMYFLPNTKDNKHKLTSLNYRILQSNLAQYQEGDADALKRIFVSSKLIGNNDKSLDNPIVVELCKDEDAFHDIKKLYETYLEKRLHYLQSVRNLGTHRDVFFLKGGNTKWSERNEDFYRSLAGRYLHDNYGDYEFDKSLELPRGLFEYQIRKELQKIPALKSVFTEKNEVNIAYLIYAYFTKVEGDAAQPFYSYKRCYSIFNALYKNEPKGEDEYRSENQLYDLLNKKKAHNLYKDITNYTLTEKDKKANIKLTDKKVILKGMLHNLKENENVLKRYRVQDMLLFMLAVHILKDKTVGTDSSVREQMYDKLNLKNITKGNVLSQHIPFSILVHTLSGECKRIEQKDFKLKNYSQFFKFLHDRRMPTLLELIAKDTIERNDIEKELTSYDSVHPEIIRDVLDYEHAFFDKYGPMKVPTKRGERYYEFKDMIDSNTSVYDKEDMYILRKIRNSFAHLAYATEVEKAKDTAGNDSEIPNKANVISEEFTKRLKKDSF